jgi:hypothetical protein
VRSRAAAVEVSISTGPAAVRSTVMFANVCRKTTSGARISARPVGFQS